MTTEKLAAALRRMQAKGSQQIMLKEPIRVERRGRMVDSWRDTMLDIAAALVIIKDRIEFTGVGTGRNVRCIIYRPIDPSAKWQECYLTTSAPCIPHYTDQRSNAA